MKYFTTCTVFQPLTKLYSPVIGKNFSEKGLDICVTICIIGIAVTQK